MASDRLRRAGRIPGNATSKLRLGCATALFALVWAIPAGAFSQTYQILPGSSLAIGAGTSEGVRGSLTLEAECDLVVSENCIFIGSAKYTITQLLLATDAYRFEASGEFPTLEAPNGGTLDVARALEVENTIVVGGSPVPFVSYGFDPEPTGAADTFSIWTLRGAEEAGGEPLSLARGFDAEPFRDELSLELDLSELIVEVQALGFDFAPGGRTGRASLELVVPEPTSAGLLVFGLALLGGSRGRLVGTSFRNTDGATFNSRLSPQSSMSNQG